MVEEQQESHELAELTKLFQNRQVEDDFERSILEPKNDLKNLLRSKPDEYIRCTLGTDASRCLLAKTVDKNSPVREVQLDKPVSLPHGTQFVVKIIDRRSVPKPIGVFWGKLMENPPYQAMKTRAQLQGLMNDQPEKYKICQLHLEGPQLGWARPLSIDDRISKIQLKGRSNCGRACQDDEVVVEIMNDENLRSSCREPGATGSTGTTEPCGRVVSVSKQREHLRYKLFVCEMLDAPGTCVRPLCSTVPKISYDNKYARLCFENSQKRKSPNHRSLRKKLGITTKRERLKEMPYEYANKNLVSIYSPVYDETTRQFQFRGKSILKVTKHNCQYLFIVCFMDWPVQKYYPRGKVIHVVSKLHSFLNGIELLHLIHGIPFPQDEADTKREVKHISELVNNNIRTKDRKDYRKHLTVTIDNPETKDMDDAISLHEDANGRLTVGVHITDVAEFIGENTPIDQEARRRGTTFYPSKEARQRGVPTNHMLPRQLAENSLSLVEGQDRRCLSVVFNMNADGVVENWRPCLTLIRSDKRLNKEDVQRVILGNTDSVEPRVSNMLLRLWSVTRAWRVKRLGQAAFVRQRDEQFPETSALVEELMVAANSAVGEFLRQRADSVPAYPIRVQQRPREIDVTRWMQKHGSKAQHSAELSRALHLVEKDVPNSNMPFQMHQDDAESLKAFCQRGDMQGALSLLYDERRFPHLRLAISDWHGLSQPAKYSECTSEQRRHFSLEKEDYVHFTSPMRRYADLMVHRALRSALKGFEESKLASHSVFNITGVCEHLSFMMKKSRKLDDSCTCADYGLELAARPKRVLVQISTLDDEGIYFEHDFLEHSPKVAKHIKFRAMNILGKPEVHKEFLMAICSWKARILQHSTAEIESEPKKQEKGCFRPIRVSNLCFDTFFRPDELMKAKRDLLPHNGNYEQCSLSEHNLMEADITERRGVSKIFASLQDGRCTAWFFRDFHLGDEIRAQIGAENEHGTMVPALQLVEICETFSICLTHQRRPADHFEHVARRRSQRVYEDVNEYADIWQEIVAMESASVSIKNNETFVLCDVPLLWKWDDSNLRWLGMFNLTEQFCQSRKICFTDAVLTESSKSWKKKLEDASNKTKRGKKQGVSDVTNAVFKAAANSRRYAEYICLRTKIKDESGDEFTWVGHGGVLLVFEGLHCRSDRCSHSSVHFCNFVVFHLNEVSPVKSPSQESLSCATVELVMKFLPMRRHELVLQSVRSQSEHGIPGRLVRWDRPECFIGVDTTLYHQALRHSSTLSFKIRVTGKNHFERTIPCNDRQMEAIRAAIERQVSLIWGPPGTGKTTTGVMLIYWFVFINLNRQDRVMEHEQAASSADEDGEKKSADQDSQHEDHVDQLSHCDGFQTVSHQRGRRITASCSKPTLLADKRRRPMQPVWKKQSRRQILCCGPSNRSVDVIVEASRDLLLNQCPSMVRVYSEQVERVHYPIPGELATADEVVPAMRRYALHELIRSENSDESYIICGFDTAFRKFIGSQNEPAVTMEQALKIAADSNSRFERFIRGKRLRSNKRGVLALVEEEAGGDSLVQGCVKLYKDKVLKAKMRVLQNFDVVLCTTSVSCSSVIQRACRFVQIIIDEAGMCTQPELLVPIVGRLNVESENLPSCLGVATRRTGKAASEFAERVVLIGDHKQLAPIIQNKTAAELGLSKTFLEMHCLDSVMLNQQYRMHPSLADFPSKRFYTVRDSGGLRTQPSKSWTGVLDTETKMQAGCSSQWNGLNWHKLNKAELFDSKDASGVRRHGLLTERNANVLHGCWPGVRRDRPFDTLPDVPVSEFHPMGEEERIVFLHIEGREERTFVATEDGREDSYKNEQEIDTVVQVYREILHRLSGPDRNDPRRCVALMSQYRFQVAAIKQRLQSESLPMPTVSTVIACQGSEFAYVLLSLVRSMPSYDIEENPLPGWERKFLGFITDENQTNVALTRAQRGLIIVGNKKLLCRDPNWSHLLHDLQERGCIPMHAKDFPNHTGFRRALTRSGRL